MNSALERHADSSLGMTIQELLSSLATAFRQAYATGTKTDPVSIDDDGDTQMRDHGAYESADGEEEADEGEEEDADEVEEEEADEEEYYDPYENLSDDGFETGVSARKIDPKTAAKLNARIRHDLQIVKQSGFKVGVIQGMAADSETSVLSISIRVSKLGLSEEAIQAWDLKAEQYVVLLIRYSLGYKSFEFVMEHGVAKEIQGIEFRVGLCNRYKPTIAEGMAAFSDAKREASKKDEPEQHQKLAGFSSLFISSSLNDFMNTRFVPMMKYRAKFGINWDGAKMLFNRQQGTNDCEEQPDHLPDEYFGSDVPEDKVLPAIAQADHLVGTSASSEPSFPLIAMQFCMRYFIRCPEFCLICHDKTTETFEALKPYVCSRPLCLFQYMQLGFGPSIEHEINTQPYVVDLLISFCYAAAKARRIRTYPLGQHILVPPQDKADQVNQPMDPYSRSYFDHQEKQPTNTQQVSPKPARIWNVKFDALKHEVIIDDPNAERGNFGVHEWYECNDSYKYV